MNLKKEENRLKNTLSPITIRIGLIINLFFKNKKKFAEEIGYHKQKIYDITTGKIKPDVDLLYRITKNAKMQRVNVRWILTGQGEMLIASSSPLQGAIFIKKTLNILKGIESVIKKEYSSADKKN